MQHEGRRACSKAGVVLGDLMCLDLLEPNTEQMQSCVLQRVQHQLFVTSFLCSDCGFAVTVGLAARQLFLPQLSEQRPALHSSSTAVLGQSAQSDSFCTTAPSTLTQTLQFILGVSSSGVCRSGGRCCVQGFTAERSQQLLLTLSSHASHPSSLHYSLWLYHHPLD